MFGSRSSLALAALILLLLAVLTGLTLFNYRYASQNPGGNDFLPRWVGTRMFLTKGWSPYSDQTTREIQQLAYRRPAQAGENPELFVYPFYSALVFAPFAVIEEYLLARALFMTVLEAALIGLAAVSLALARWRLSGGMLALLLLFSLFWYHGVQPVINGNASILVALLIGLAFLSIRAGYDPLAGILLALSSIKPQITILLIIFVLLWAMSQSRWTLFWSTLASLAFLVAVFSLFIPDWLFQNVRQVLTYPDYFQNGTPGAIFTHWLPGVGSQMGWALTGIMAIFLMAEWRAAVGKEEFNWFFWTASLTLVITNLVGIRTATENFIALYPALILVFANWDQRWSQGGRGMVLFSLALLFFGLWGLFLGTLESGAQPVSSPVMFFPLPAFLLMGLYWVRWWAIRPPRVFLDELRVSRHGS